MGYSFEYIDIMLAMIAGFIFLRLRGILAETGFEGSSFSKEVLKTVNKIKKINEKFDDELKNFLKGAKIAYETII